MVLDNVVVRRLSPDYFFTPFDCGDDDLNNFLLDDSINYLNECLAVTYIVENEKESDIIAYFTVQNDKISLEDFPSKSQFYKARKKIPQSKIYNSYPAVKIGRLAVSRKYAGQGYGSALLDYLKILFVTNNRTGCRFMLVDAYNDRVSFYQHAKFKLLKPFDDASKTQLMYCDLMTIQDSL